jgi:prepilin-type N-terminal cleavage/methylation domain-containing protein
MNTLSHTRRFTLGFSLLEMAVVLAIVGLIGALLWQLLPRLQATANPEPTPVVELRTATDAVLGFALAQSRLPCPDTDGDGLEDCASVANNGFLPQRTLGQVFPKRMRYGVNRQATSNLTILSNRYLPNIPGTAPATPVLNGLDLCIGIRDGQASGGDLTVGAAIVTAFALASSGAGDASGDGNLFDGLNVTGFAAPGTAITNGYDDYSVAIGFGELAQRMGCMTRLAEVNGAARSSVAARDLYDLSVFYRDFRFFAWDATRTTDVTLAILTITLAVTDTLLAVANLALAAAETYESAGAAFFTIAIATVGVADAAANLALAIIGEIEAQEAAQLASDQYDDSIVKVAAYLANADATRNRARAEDALGLIK